MASFDYYGLELELQAILQGDSTLSNVRVLVEEAMAFADESPMIGIYAESRTPGQQYMSAGQHQQYTLSLSLWIFVWGVDLPIAIRTRDDLLGKLEVALMNNRTINNLARDAWLEGGDMAPAFKPKGGGVVVGAETRLKVDIAFTI